MRASDGTALSEAVESGVTLPLMRQADHQTWAAIGGVFLGVGTTIGGGLAIASTQASRNLWAQPWFLAIFALCALGAVIGAYVLSALFLPLWLPPLREDEPGEHPMLRRDRLRREAAERREPPTPARRLVSLRETINRLSDQHRKGLRLKEAAMQLSPDDHEAIKNLAWRCSGWARNTLGALDEGAPECSDDFTGDGSLAPPPSRGDEVTLNDIDAFLDDKLARLSAILKELRARPEAGGAQPAPSAPPREVAPKGRREAGRRGVLSDSDFAAAMEQISTDEQLDAWLVEHWKRGKLIEHEESAVPELGQMIGREVVWTSRGQPRALNWIRQLRTALDLHRRDALDRFKTTRFQDLADAPVPSRAQILDVLGFYLGTLLTYLRERGVL